MVDRGVCRRVEKKGMIMLKRMSLLGVGLLTAVAGFAQESYMQGKAFFVADYKGNRVAKVEADGSVSWSHPARSSNDLWVWADSALFATGHGVKEVVFAGDQVRFEYNSSSEIFACQKLGTNAYLVGECTGARLLEMTADGKVTKELKLKADGKGDHGFMRNVRKLENGHYLVAYTSQHRVAELDADGTEVWSFGGEGYGVPHSLTRLANGNTMISFGENAQAQVCEVAPDKSVVWSLTNKDFAEETRFGADPLKFMTGFFVLPNGNLLVSSWVGHGFVGKYPHLFEVTRDKRVVWSYADHAAFKAIASVFVLDASGKPLCGIGRH